MDILKNNSAAWDKYVEGGIEWSIPVDEAAIAAARQGNNPVWLTDKTPVPSGWFEGIPGRDALCLASGGGQQAPLLAAAGFNVTSYDNSPRQLAQDKVVAERDGLNIHTMQGDMADLSVFDDASFDLVFHPISNLFAESVLPVWREAYRVLRPGGILMAAFFVITDPVTHPGSQPGQWLFGGITAAITFVIRDWGGYPDGIAFAVLIANAATPLIDRAFRQGLSEQSLWKSQ